VLTTFVDLAKLPSDFMGDRVNRKTKTKFEMRAKILKAMAHPTRLFIVDELSRDEQCVQKLTELIGADTSTVSKHLSVLRNAGIVQNEKRGSQVFYSLTVPCVLNFFDCVESVLKARLEKQMDLMK